VGWNDLVSVVSCVGLLAFAGRSGIAAALSKVGGLFTKEPPKPVEPLPGVVPPQVRLPDNPGVAVYRYLHLRHQCILDDNMEAVAELEKVWPLLLKCKTRPTQTATPAEVKQ